MHSHGHGNKRFNHQNWERLVNTERQQWQDVDKFFEIAQPTEEDVWLDFGCGPGYFTVPLAEKVKQVIAIDVSAEMLAVCQQRIKDHQLTNVLFLQSDEKRVPVADNTVDKALLANIYHELDHHKAFFAELQRILKNTGTLFIIDWKPVESPTGPPMDHRIPETDVIREVESLGFPLRNRWDIYPYHYVLEFAPSGK